MQFIAQNYRVNLSPFNYILSSFDIDFQVQNPNEYSPTTILQTENNSQFKGLLDIATYLENSLLQKQNQQIVVKSENLQQVIEIYEKLIQQIEQNKFVLQDANQLISECFNKFINKDQQTTFSLSDAFFYESIKLVLECNNQIQSGINKQIMQFLINFELNPHIQQSLFSKEQLLLDFSPSLHNNNRQIQQITEKNLPDFIALANQSGAQYQFKKQIQENEELIYTDHVPFSAKPILLGRDQLQEFKAKGDLWNKILNNMASDDQFIEETFKGMDDDFLNRHLQIWKKVKNCKYANNTNFTITRNDVMMDSQTNRWCQIEYNTHSVSFAHISDTVQDFQSIVKNCHLKDQLKNFDQNIDKNNNYIAQDLFQAHQLYNKQNSIVIMVVDAFDGNSYDQRYIELELAKLGVKMYRKTFLEIYQSHKKDSEGNIYVDGNEVSVFYFRSGYAPAQFVTEEYWQAREIIELSRAIKCPNIRLSLINFKKAQQVLQNDEILRKFVDSDQELLQTKQNFVQIYNFENEEEQQNLIEKSKQHINDYILKPQREGGANNYYGQDIVDLLESISKQERKNYILMKKIKPQPTCGFLIKNRKLEVAAVVCEIGILGSFIGQGKNKVLHNRTAGYLCRTKKFFESEGGVATGYAVIDSIMHNKQ